MKLAAVSEDEDESENEDEGESEDENENENMRVFVVDLFWAHYSIVIDAVPSLNQVPPVLSLGLEYSLDAPLRVAPH